MTQRSKDYMIRRKARSDMNRPLDLKSFLVAEYNSSRNLIVKKDVEKMIRELEGNNSPR